MASKNNALLFGTVVLSVAMMGFGILFYEKGSAMYLVLLFIGIVLALIVGGSFMASNEK